MLITASAYAPLQTEKHDPLSPSQTPFHMLEQTFLPSSCSPSPVDMDPLPDVVAFDLHPVSTSFPEINITKWDATKDNVDVEMFP